MLRRSRFFYGLLVALVMMMLAWRVAHLRADFLDLSLVRGGLLYTDEGWYANNAIRHALTGHWYAADDMNFAVNLPTLQFFYALMFQIFGYGIVSARLTILVFFTLTLALMFATVRAHADKWTALLAVALIVFNHYFFCFSRLALAEIPMTFFVCAALFMASRASGRWTRLLVWASGISLALAVLTKTTAVFAGPLYVALLWWTNRSRRGAWIAPAMGLGAFAICMLIYFLFLAIPYLNDFLFFQKINVGIHFDLSPATIAEQFHRIVYRAHLIDDRIFRLVHWGLPALLIFVRRARRDPLLWVCVAYYLLYVAMFSFYFLARNRYWMPLMVPYGIGGALLIRHLALLAQDAEKKIPRQLGIALLIGASGFIAFYTIRNTVKISQRMMCPQYSFATMASDVWSKMRSDPQANRVLIGHLATTVSLYEPCIPINDRYGPASLAERLERYQPRYLVTEEPLEKTPATDSKHDSLSRVWCALQRFYHVEMVATYDVLENRNRGPVLLYRLRPLQNDSLQDDF